MNECRNVAMGIGNLHAAYDVLRRRKQMPARVSYIVAAANSVMTVLQDVAMGIKDVCSAT